MSKAASKLQLLVVVACVLAPSDSETPGDTTQQALSRVLLVRRREAVQKEIHLMWELPGGKVDFGETAEQAVVREMREETGYHVDIVGLLPFSYATEWEYEDLRQHTVIYCYECRVSERPEAQAPEDHKVEEQGWFRFDEIDFSRVLPGSREFIWHVAKQYSVELTSYVPKIAYASFIRIDPSQNIRRVYSIVLQINPATEWPYVVTTRRGRLGSHGTGRPIIEFFSSDKEARDRILYHLKRRHWHGYAVSEYSDNFPLQSFLETFSEARTNDRQLSLW